MPAESIGLGESIEAVVVKAVSAISNVNSELINIGENIKANLAKAVYNYNLSSAKSDSIAIGENINARVVTAIPTKHEFDIMPIILISALIFLFVLIYLLKNKKQQKYNYRSPS